MPINLNEAFRRLAVNRDKADTEKFERTARANEARQQCADECQASFGGLGYVEVSKPERGVFLDAKANGWMSIEFVDADEGEIRVGTKPADVVPRDTGITTYSFENGQELSDMIAVWYSNIPKGR